MVKLIIANDNDILYNSLSNTFLHNNEEKIEILKVPQNEVINLLYKIGEKNLIILDTSIATTFYTNILKNAINNLDMKKLNIIILVINSDSISNTSYAKKHFLLKKKPSIINILDTVSNAINDSIKLEEEIDNIFWKLGFTSYFKGCTYLKDAIIIAYNDKNLLNDTKKLVIEVSKKHNIKHTNIVRSNMDRALNSMLNYVNTDMLYEIFGNDYDGRKISLKYFVDLFVRYLEKQRYCCLN